MSSRIPERLWGREWRTLLVGDLAVVAALAALTAAAAYLPARAVRAARAEVRVGREVAASLDLARDGVSEVRGVLGNTKLEVRGGKVRVLSSPCPLQVCRHGGWIERPGEMLVCLPNAVVVRIPGSGPDTDAVSR